MPEVEVDEDEWALALIHRDGAVFRRLLAEVRRLAERPTIAELRERMQSRSTVTGVGSAADAVRRERDAR